MISYKKYIGILLLIPTLAFGAQEPEAEIVIELTGEPDPVVSTADDIVIWDKNAQQLSKLLKDKTREEALRRITSVSSKDASVEASDGTRYRMVQYGTEAYAYKLLFRAKHPQTFIACSVGTQEALQLAMRYKLGLGITENEFLRLYSQDTSSVSLPIDDGQTLYRLNRPHQSPLFFLFKNKILSRSLTQRESDQLISEQKSLLHKQEQQALEAQKAATTPRRKTVLTEGGTLYDQLYMPRLVYPKEFPDTPHLVPSDIPAGTPLPQEIIPQ